MEHTELEGSYKYIEKWTDRGQLKGYRYIIHFLLCRSFVHGDGSDGSRRATKMCLETRRIHQIEVGRVGQRVIGTKSTFYYVEVLSMEMDRMALEEQQRCFLKHDLDRRIVVEYFYPCPHHRQEPPSVCSPGIERNWWVVRKIRQIHIADLVVICLQHQI